MISTRRTPKRFDGQKLFKKGSISLSDEMNADPEALAHDTELSSSSSNVIRHGSDSSEAELLLANEEDQDVGLRFKRPAEHSTAETNDESHIAVQQFAKTSHSTKASKPEKPLKAGVEDFIPRRTTTVLTKQEDSFVTSRERSKKKLLIQSDNMVTPNKTDKAACNTDHDDTQFEMVSAEILEERERRKRALIIGAVAVIGIAALIAGGIAVKRALNKN